jgi:uncharacterized peroxidase-related enzyme
MRVAALDHGHRGRARVAVWLMDKVIGHSPDVLTTLVYRPNFFGRHASRALQQIMGGPSPWSVTDRELFAAYTSRLNQCPFCAGQHGAVASPGLGKDVIEAVYADRATAPVSAEVKAALSLIETITLRPDELGPDDIEAARTAGLSNEAIEHVFDVATIFNLINRLADAFEFNVPDQERLDQDAKVVLRFGYRFPQFLFPRP